MHARAPGCANRRRCRQPGRRPCRSSAPRSREPAPVLEGKGGTGQGEGGGYRRPTVKARTDPPTPHLLIKNGGAEESHMVKKGANGGFLTQGASIASLARNVLTGPRGAVREASLARPKTTPATTGTPTNHRRPDPQAEARNPTEGDSEDLASRNLASFRRTPRRPRRRPCDSPG